MKGKPYYIHIRGVAVAENALDMFAGSLMWTLRYLHQQLRKPDVRKDVTTVRIYRAAIAYINQHYIDQGAVE